MCVPSYEEIYNALAERHGTELQKKLSETHVAVCGLGGLGSNIAVALLRAGIFHIHIIDFDKVDISNINRQQYFINQVGQYKTDALYQNMMQIMPYASIKRTCIRLTDNNIPDILKDEYIICEAFDNAESKAELADCILSRMPDKYLVCGSGMAGFSSANTIQTRRISRRFYICGDGKSDISDGIGLVSSRVMVCAGHQAHMVIRIINNEFDV